MVQVNIGCLSWLTKSLRSELHSAENPKLKTQKDLKLIFFEPQLKYLVP